MSSIYVSNLQAEAKILKGPHENLEGYLEAIEQLRTNIRFFTNNNSFKSSDGVVNHANNLLSKAISKLENEFKQLLTSYRFVWLFEITWAGLTRNIFCPKILSFFFLYKYLVCQRWLCLDIANLVLEVKWFRRFCAIKIHFGQISTRLKG